MAVFEFGESGETGAIGRGALTGLDHALVGREVWESVLLEEFLSGVELGGSGEVEGFAPVSVGHVDDGVGFGVVHLPDVVAAVGVAAGSGEDGRVEIAPDAPGAEAFWAGLPAFKHFGVVFVSGLEFEDGAGPGAVELTVDEVVGAVRGLHMAGLETVDVHPGFLAAVIVAGRKPIDVEGHELGGARFFDSGGHSAEDSDVFGIFDRSVSSEDPDEVWRLCSGCLRNLPYWWAFSGVKRTGVSAHLGFQ